jgi:RNA polymerase sigma-70 factor (ECF subfamily)
VGKAAEDDLIRRARSGEDEALAELVESYQRPVYNLCYRMLGDPAEAEEAAQETFLRAYKNLSSFDLERPFVNWILSIGSNYCVDQIRRRKFEWLDLSRLAERQASPMDIEHDLAEAEEGGAIRSLLTKLRPSDRAAIVLRYWHDMSINEIAETLGISVGAAKTRLHRARKRLATGLQEAGLHPEGRQDEPSAI